MLVRNYQYSWTRLELNRPSAATSKTRTPQFLSTHPAPENRQGNLAKLESEMAKYYTPDAEHPVYPLYN